MESGNERCNDCRNCCDQSADNGNKKLEFLPICLNCFTLGFGLGMLLEAIVAFLNR